MYTDFVDYAHSGFRKDFFYGIIKAAANRLALKKTSISIVLSPAKMMKDLNKSLRGKSYTPNVLALPAIYNNEGYKGEIYILAKKKLSKQQAATLFVHGLLHLFGYDHKRAKDFKKMKTIERQILSDV